jgi:hypothetical protein
LFIGEIFLGVPQLPLSLQLGYPFQSFGRKSPKSFHCHPSREKGNKIYDFLSTMKSVTKMKKPSFNKKIELILN